MTRVARELDFNVIYRRTSYEDSSVEDFVTYIVEKVLELERLKGFYAKRDLLPGKNQFTEAFTKIEVSTFTILVICRGFLANDWSMYWSHVSNNVHLLS